jgi:N-acetylneuraminate synthase
MNASITIGNRQVGLDHPPSSSPRCPATTTSPSTGRWPSWKAAAKSGAHALKLQTYTADTMTLDIDEGEFYIEDPNSLWKGASLHKLYQQAYTPWEWHAPIFKRANELGMLAFSTPFDERGGLSSKASTCPATRSPRLKTPTCR